MVDAGFVLAEVLCSIAFNDGPSVHVLAGGGSWLKAGGEVVERPRSLGFAPGVSVHRLAVWFAAPGLERAGSGGASCGGSRTSAGIG